MRPPPVEAPPPPRHVHPAEPLHGRAARVVVEHGGARVEAARVGRGVPPEPLRVQVVAELVAQRAEERAEGGDVLTHSRPHPDPDPHRGGCVVPEELNSPPALIDPARAGGQDADPRPGHAVEGGGDGEKRRTSVAHGCARPVWQRRLEGHSWCAQAVIRRHLEGSAPIAGEERCEACGIAWGRVREHHRVPVLGSSSRDRSHWALVVRTTVPLTAPTRAAPPPASKPRHDFVYASAE
jgi:hypothetical protein